MTQASVCRLTVCALLCFSLQEARGQNDWTRQFGTLGQEEAFGVAVHGGSVYIAGITDGTLPDQASAGNFDAFVRKYDANGNHVWTRQFGSSGHDAARALAVDGTGVYVAGYTTGTLPGAANAGGADAFVRKYDTDGNLLWNRQFGSSSYDNAAALAVDGTSVYVAGVTDGTLPGQASAGNFDSFVRKYDVSGNIQWTRQLGSSGDDFANAVTVDGTGVYIAGDVTYGSMPGQSYSVDVFVRKHEANGGFQWARQFGTSSEDVATGIAVDGTGVYITGWTADTLPGQTRAGASDAFVRKYDASGDLQWTRQFGSSDQDLASGIATDGTGVYIAGSTGGTLEGQTKAGDFDVFVRKYDANGNPQWTRQFGTSRADAVNGLAVDNAGVYVAGGTAAAFSGQTSVSRFDAFVRKIDISQTLHFLPIVPCRLVDTRPGQGATGPFGPPNLPPNSTRTIAIPDGPCSIPTAAKAFSLNVTVVPHEPLAYLSLWPTGEPQPVVSTLNSFHGGVVANAAIVPAGTGGAINAFVTNRTDLIIDINGYFVDNSSPQALSFYPLHPCRIADTRGPFTGAFGPPILTANTARSFPLPDGSCGIPGWAAAYSLNATVAPGQTLGYLTLWPSEQPRPLASNLNSFDGAIVANAVIVKGGTNGAVAAFATDKADLILDTNGFFGPAGNPGERLFKPLAPCRISDTRLEGSGGPMFGGETRDFSINGKCGVPVDAKAYSLNVTVAPAGPLSYLSLWPAGTTRPVVSTLNSFLGRVVANAAIVPAGLNGAVSVYVTGATDVILDVNGYFQ